MLLPVIICIFHCVKRFQVVKNFTSNKMCLKCHWHTCVCRPHMLRSVVGDDVDLVFKVLHQLIEFLLSAIALCINLYFCADSLRFTRFNVSQIYMLLLQGICIFREENMILFCFAEFNVSQTWKIRRALIRHPTSFFNAKITTVFPESWVLLECSLSGFSSMRLKDVLRSCTTVWKMYYILCITMYF